MSSESPYPEQIGAPLAAQSADPYLELPAHAGDAGSLTVGDGLGKPDAARIVDALLRDELPLLNALWPGAERLVARMPGEDALSARLAYVNVLLNQISRRSGEWRARAELAGVAVSRRIALLTGDGRTLADAARDELSKHVDATLEARVLALAGSEGVLYPRDVRRLADDAASLGRDVHVVEGMYERHGVRIVEHDVSARSQLTALPGAPADVNAVCDALLANPTQGLVAIREGALLKWLRENHAREDLLRSSADAQRTAAGAEHPQTAVFQQLWALGRNVIVVGDVVLDAPETLLHHLRAARIHASHVESAAASLAAWFRHLGHDTAASACERLGTGDRHALDRLRWSLGEPFRLAGRSVTDPTTLAREVLTRTTSRSAALDHFHEGTLRAWLESFSRARRDARWLDDLTREPRTDDRAFFRGIYRHQPRAPLRVAVGAERFVRFATPADLLVTAHVAAVWEPLKQLLRSGELVAWLEAVAPGIDFDTERKPASDDDDLNDVLWRLGHTGLVLAWGSAGFPVVSPADLVSAWTQSWQRLEAQLARDYVFEFLERIHGEQSVYGFPLRLLARAVRAATSSAPIGWRALVLALICGSDALPIDPRQPAVHGALRGYSTIDGTRTDRASWTPLEAHIAHGTALLWAARHVRSLAPLVARRWVDGVALESNEIVEALVSCGVPVPTAALEDGWKLDQRTADHERECAAAEREAERLTNAARVASARAAEREAERAALEREAERLGATARLATLRASERMAAEREASRLALARAAAEREANRLAALRDAEREAALRESERISREREIERVAAQGDASRLAAERREAEVDAARSSTERIAAEREAERLADLRRAMESEATRLASERLEAEREAKRLVAERTVAERAAADRGAELAALVARAEARAPQAFEARPPDDALPIDGLVDDSMSNIDPPVALAALASAGLAVFDGGADSLMDLPSGVGGLRADDAPFAPPERHELDPAMLDEATVIREPTALSMLRNAVDAWASARGQHPYRDLGTGMEILEATRIPVFSTVVNSRVERRRIDAGATDAAALESVHVPAAPDGQLDAWAVSLPDVDTWTSWVARYRVDEATRESACGACAGQGAVPCVRCDASGARRCARCEGLGDAQCARCAGSGEVQQGRVRVRCAECSGRGKSRCPACRAGWVECPACRGKKSAACERCVGSGVSHTERTLTQRYECSAALNMVRGEVPESVAADARHEALGPVPVAFIEAPEIDAFALSREIDNPALASSIADVLAQDHAGVPADGRITRQRVIVRRYEAYRVRYEHAGRDDELWVHGAARRVHATDDPIARYAASLAPLAERALAANDLELALTTLIALDAAAPGHVAGASPAKRLADGIVALARRGDPARARDLASRVGVLRWAECAAVIRDGERASGGAHPRSSMPRVEVATRVSDDERRALSIARRTAIAGGVVPVAACVAAALMTSVHIAALALLCTVLAWPCAWQAFQRFVTRTRDSSVLQRVAFLYGAMPVAIVVALTFALRR